VGVQIIVKVLVENRYGYPNYVAGIWGEVAVDDKTFSFMLFIVIILFAVRKRGSFYNMELVKDY
jgi:hypothetical protein